MASRALWVCCMCAALALAALLTNPSARRRCSHMMMGRWGSAVPGAQPRGDECWKDTHGKYVEAVEDADQPGKGFGLLFYGDSITETWAGTDCGRPCPRCAGVPEIFNGYFGKYNPKVLAIGGDQSGHLLWRIQNGEVPKINAPKVIVILIGTNDLGAGANEGEPGTLRAADVAIANIILIVRYLRDNLPDTHVILSGILPRGGTNPLYRYRLPNVFTQAVDQLSWRIKALTNVDAHLHFVDCGDHFVTPDQSSIKAEIMPDALHPNAAGMELLAECLYPDVNKWMRPEPTYLVERVVLPRNSTERGVGA